MTMNQNENESGQMPDVELGEIEEQETTPSEIDTVDLDTEIEIDELSLLQENLADAQSKAEEYMDGWQRSRAEFTNYKKRVERDRVQMRENATASVIKRYLDIVDDLKRALENRPQDGDGATWAEGIELIYRKLQTLLENEGVYPMNANGQEFDPNRHEAISLEESPDHESGEIIEVLKEGYLIGDRVIRPATVRVAQ